MVAHRETPSHDDAPDAWHTHTHGEPPPQHAHMEEIPAARVLGFGLISHFSLMVLMTVIAIYFYAQVSEMKTEREEYPELNDASRAIQATQLAHHNDLMKHLNGPAGWSDAQAGLVRVPLESAMDGVLKKYGTGERGGPSAPKPPATSAVVPVPGTTPAAAPEGGHAPAQTPAGGH